MKKSIPLFTLILLSAVALTSLAYVRFNQPAAGTSYALSYDGIYIDLLTQEKVDALRSEPAGTELHIVKVNQDGYVPGTTFAGNGSTEHYVAFDYQGIELQLHFLDDVLLECRKTASQEIRELKEGMPTEELSEEAVNDMELYALETLLKNKSWVTDPQVLQDVLTEYSRQVQAYFDKA